MGFSFTLSTHSRHSSPTLFTAHASRTHVKALQTDFHVKPDNSSGLTHNSPPKRPLRKKATFQHKKAPKEHRGKPWKHKAARRPPKPSTDQLCSMLRPVGNRDQGPKGNIGTKPVSSSMLRAMEGASKTSGQNPWLHASATEAIKAWYRRSVSVSLSLERKTKSFFLSL